MATTQEWAALGTETTVLSTGLNSLANNALAISSAFNNTQGNTGLGYTLCRVKVLVQMGTAAAANTGFSIWFLKSTDGGSTYESGGTSYTPLRLPDLVIPAPVDTTARTVSLDVMMPAGYFAVLFQNAGTGQSLASSGNVVTLTPITPQMV